MLDLIHGRAALLVIDMQCGFIDDDAGSYVIDSEQLISRVGCAMATARSLEMPVLLSREVHRMSGVDGGRLLWDGRGGWVSKHVRYGSGKQSPTGVCIEGTRQAELLPQLAPEPDDIVFEKRRASCFLGTELDLLLGRLGVETLFVSGICTDVCVLWTVGDAFQRDFHVRVLEDCVAGTTVAAHKRALALMRDLTTAGEAVYSDALAAAVAR
jgi:biuret amidohydrolase